MLSWQKVCCFLDYSSVDYWQVKVEAPTPKKRKTRKSALGDVSVNAPRFKAPRSKKVAVTGSPRKRQSSSGRQNRGLTRVLYNPKPMPTLNPLAAFGRKYAALTDEEEEFRMTLEDMNRKRTFSIFKDAPEESPGISTSYGFVSLLTAS